MSQSLSQKGCFQRYFEVIHVHSYVNFAAWRVRVRLTPPVDNEHSDMGTNKEAARKLLSAAAAARRLDMTARRLEKAIEAGTIVPVGMLNDSPVFAEEDVLNVTSDLIRLRQVRG
jgi:hypothetical protein